MSLSLDERRIINDMAQSVRQIYEIDDVIKNIDEIVISMNGKIEEDSSMNAFSDGRIFKSGPDSFIISISPNQSKQRRNFTIAHELGHLFLHMGFQTNPLLWESQNNTRYYRSGKSREEYQANEFAAAFLMPNDLFDKAIKAHMQNNSVDVALIADYFNVSIDAAVNRGKWLGYFEW